MKKRGLSTIVTAVILVLLCIIAITLIWFFISRIIQSNIEVADVTQTLMSENFNINSGAKIAQSSPPTYQVVISLGPMRIKDTVKTTITKVPNADIISVVDLSGSMNTIENLVSRLSVAKDANIYFINQVLGNPQISNRVGLVTYSESTLNTVSLTSEIPTLITGPGGVNSWLANGDTCICCGINSARSLYQINEKQKVMIIMTDGQPTRACVTSNEFKDALDAASNARSNNIDTYVIGLGNQIDPTYLKQLAGDPSHYYSANIETLTNTYSKIITQTMTVPNADIKSSYLRAVFYNANGESSIADIYDFPKQSYESKVFDIAPKPDMADAIRIELYPVIVTKSGKEIVAQNPSAVINLKKNL